MKLAMAFIVMMLPWETLGLMGPTAFANITTRLLSKYSTSSPSYFEALEDVQLLLARSSHETESDHLGCVSSCESFLTRGDTMVGYRPTSACTRNRR